MFEGELKFLVTAIQGHPKSYWVWHHRVWVLEHMPKPNWEYEVHLCAKMLDLDIRNCEEKSCPFLAQNACRIELKSAAFFGA